MRNQNRVADKRRRQAKGENCGNPYDAIVIYNSAGGSTMQYAQWIADELDCDIVPYSRKYLSYASLYRNVIFGGWLRAAEITRLMLLRQNESNFDLRSKNVVVYAVGVGPEDDPEYVRLLSDANGIDNLYFLPGKYDPAKASVSTKASLKAMQETMYTHYDDETAALIRGRLENGYDGVDKSRIQPIIDNVKATAHEE